MAESEKKNIAASVRQRLLNLSKATEQNYQILLTRFALERLLYRLSKSRHSDRFILKGGMLVTAWFDNPFRPTRDLDFLGFGDPKPENIIAIFKEILSENFDDGVDFDWKSIIVDNIREELEYGGLRLKTNANIAGAKISIVIDIGFGDATEPGVTVLKYPSLLDFPTPSVRAYAPETVIAEKFQAIVALGEANSRMKDFYDIWELSRFFKFESDSLAKAITATFARRKTQVPTEIPYALSQKFTQDISKQKQWKAFVESIGIDELNFTELVATISEFLMRHSAKAVNTDM